MHSLLIRVLLAGLLLMPSLRLDADEPAGMRVRGDAAIRQALSGRTFYGRYDGGGDWIEYYAPDGRTAYWDGCTHDGDWWIAEDFVCFHYRGDVQGLDYCWMLYRSADQYEFVMTDDGSAVPARAYTTAVRPGNREHLPLDTDDCVSVRAPIPRAPSGPIDGGPQRTGGPAAEPMPSGATAGWRRRLNRGAERSRSAIDCVRAHPLRQQNNLTHG